jgi:hypothetical protein
MMASETQFETLFPKMGVIPGMVCFQNPENEILIFWHNIGSISANVMKILRTGESIFCI